MRVVIDDRPKHTPSAWQEMKKHERAKILAVHRNERVASRYRADRHARLKILEDSLERSLTPGARDAAMRERQRIIDYLK